MIQELVQIDKAVKFQYSRVLNYAGIKYKNILDTIDAYLTEYAEFYNLSSEETLKRYFTFVDRYVNDLEVFENTGLFPLQMKKVNGFKIQRITYDIFLILSGLLQKHRFQILKNIFQAKKSCGHCLIVGAGSGLELLSLKDKFDSLDAYDIRISNFCKHKFYDLNLFEKEYDATSRKKYDAMYAIELLEHLQSPFEILDNFRKSLKQNGKLIITVTKNVPQFDHFYNFSDECDFETKLRNIGFDIVYREVIKHNYVFFRIDARNVFYVLAKK